MERQTLATILLCLATAIAYWDELRYLLLGRFRAPSERSEPDRTAVGILDGAWADMVSGEPARMNRAAEILRSHRSPMASTLLAELLGHPVRGVAEKAVEILRARGDPPALEALFGHLSRTPAGGG